MSIFNRLGPSAEDTGMFIGGSVAAYCVWEHIQRNAPMSYVIVGGLVAWGLWGAYSKILMLKFHCDRFEKALRAAGIDPSRV